MAKYVMPPDMLKEINRVFIVNLKDWNTLPFYEIEDPCPPIFQPLPKSAIEEPKPIEADEDDRGIQS